METQYEQRLTEALKQGLNLGNFARLTIRTLTGKYQEGIRFLDKIGSWDDEKTSHLANLIDSIEDEEAQLTAVKQFYSIDGVFEETYKDLLDGESGLNATKADFDVSYQQDAIEDLRNSTLFNLRTQVEVERYKRQNE